jgi:hypothetical protein
LNILYSRSGQKSKFRQRNKLKTRIRREGDAKRGEEKRRRSEKEETRSEEEETRRAGD